MGSLGTFCYSASTKIKTRRGALASRGVAGVVGKDGNAFMVKIKWSGRFANCIFQAWAASLFGLRNGLDLGTPWPMNDWVKFDVAAYEREKKSIGFLSTGTQIINDDNIGEWLLRTDVPSLEYLFQGYFQRMDLLHPFIPFLREVFVWDKVEPLPEDHICCHTRLGDHGGAGRLYLDPSWYSSILERENFKKLTVYTDDPNAEGFMDCFKKWNPTIKFSPNAMDDFNGIRAHQKIVIGPSSFAVIAALTGHAKKIYQWERDQELPHIKYQLAGLIPGVDVVPVAGKFWREVNR